MSALTGYDEDVLRRARATELQPGASLSRDDLRDLLRIVKELEDDLDLADERETAAYQEGEAEATRETKAIFEPRIETLEEKVEDLKFELEEANARLELFA